MMNSSSKYVEASGDYSHYGLIVDDDERSSCKSIA